MDVKDILLGLGIMYGAVKSSQLSNEVEKLREALLLSLEPVSASASISASENINGLEVVLEKKGRPFVNIYYGLGGSGELAVDVSIDGSTWRTLYSFIFTEPASDIIIDQGIVYPYIRVRVPTTGIDVVLEVVAFG